MSGIFRVKPGWQVILASSSPRRQEMLKVLGLEFECHKTLTREPLPEAGEAPEVYAMRSAECKNADLLKQNGIKHVVVSADTVVCMDGKIFGKPADKGAALETLACLNGRSHWVVSAVVLRFGAGKLLRFFEKSQVTFEQMPLSVLEAYVRTGEPLDKAGAYAIQGKGSFLVKTVKGSISNIIGLPLNKLIKILLSENVIEPNM